MFTNLSTPIYVVMVLIALIFIVAVLFLAKRFLKTDQSKTITIRLAAITLLLFVLINRVVKTYFYINILHSVGYTWWSILPDTVCSFSAFVLPIALLIKPKESVIVHSVIYIALAGGIGGVIVPAYFDEFPLEVYWLTTCVLSFLMHILLTLLPLLVFVSKKFEPRMKTWYYTIISYGIAIVLGVFEIYVLHFPIEAHVMNILTPLLKGLPILTSWYMLWVGYAIGVVLFLFIYERFKNHKACLDILKEMNPFNR